MPAKDVSAYCDVWIAVSLTLCTTRIQSAGSVHPFIEQGALPDRWLPMAGVDQSTMQPFEGPPLFCFAHF
jgi:hypothetical protein